MPKDLLEMQFSEPELSEIPRTDLELIRGFIRTMSTAPTRQPRNFYEQFVIYRNGNTQSLYYYDFTNQAWVASSTTISHEENINFPSTSANSYQDVQLSITGVTAGDTVTLGVGNAAVPAGGSYFAWASATDQVTVRFVNNTTGTIDPAQALFKVRILK